MKQGDPPPPVVQILADSPEKDAEKGGESSGGREGAFDIAMRRTRPGDPIGAVII